MKRGTPVEVIWEDAHGGDSGWDDLPKKEHRPRTVRTVGLCWRDDRRGVTVVLSTVKDTGHVGGYLFIPTACIKKKHPLIPGGE